MTFIRSINYLLLLSATFLFIGNISFAEDNYSLPLSEPPCKLNENDPDWIRYSEKNSEGVDIDFNFTLDGCFDSENKPCVFYAVAYYTTYGAVQFTMFYTRDILCKNCAINNDKFAIIYQLAVKTFFKTLGEKVKIPLPTLDQGNDQWKAGYKVSIAECWMHGNRSVMAPEHNSTARINIDNNPKKETNRILESDWVSYNVYEEKCPALGCCQVTASVRWKWNTAQNKWEYDDISYNTGETQEYANTQCANYSPQCTPRCYVLHFVYVPPVQKPLDLNEKVINKGMDVSTVYPNPSNGKFTLHMNGPVSGALTLSAYDNSGKLIYSKDIQKSGDELDCNLDISGLISGKYLYTISQNGNKVCEGSFEIIK